MILTHILLTPLSCLQIDPSMYRIYARLGKNWCVFFKGELDQSLCNDKGKSFIFRPSFSSDILILL